MLMRMETNMNKTIVLPKGKILLILQDHYKFDLNGIDLDENKGNIILRFKDYE